MKAIINLLILIIIFSNIIVADKNEEMDNNRETVILKEIQNINLLSNLEDQESFDQKLKTQEKISHSTEMEEEKTFGQKIKDNIEKKLPFFEFKDE